MAKEGRPAGVETISIEGLDRFGIDPKTNQLYWDGRQVVTRSLVLIGTYERWVAAFAATGTFGTFVINVGRSCGWWH